MIVTDIRFCSEGDVGRIIEVDRTSPHPWPERVIVRDFLAGSRGLSYIGAFAPDGGDRLLGYAVLGDENGHGLLMNLVVVPAYRRQGIGSQLVVAAAECAADFRFPQLDLRVRCSNYAALALYRGVGFRGDAMRESFYNNGDVALFMSLKLPLVLAESGT